MRRLTVFIIYLPTMLIFVISGCSHIAHRARVDEGVNMSAFVMPNYETYDPPRTPYFDENRPEDLGRYARTDCQFFLGYGWKTKNDRRLMVQLIMGSTVWRSWDGFFPIGSAGIYYQGTPSDSPYALGFGAVVGPDPLLYGLWGRDFGGNSVEDPEYGIDIGAGIGLIPSVMLHAKITKDLGHFDLGFLGEYRRFWGPLDIHYESANFDDYISSQLFFGIILIPESD